MANTKRIAGSGLPDLPRGAITEISGTRGRTALIHTILAISTSQEETCALIDCADSFDPKSAFANGIHLERLLWVRCGNRSERAMKAADWILHAGGFGVVVLDLCGIAPEILRRIPLSWWYRFRRAIENTRTVLMIAADTPLTGSCAARFLITERVKPMWSGSSLVPLLAGLELKIASRKPAAAAPAIVEATLAG